MRVAPLFEEAPRSLRRTPHPEIPFKSTIIESGEEAGAAEIKNPEVFSEPGVNFY
jgi:hypothetical protein